jgi:hypothetical protein
VGLLRVEIDLEKDITNVSNEESIEMFEKLMANR